MKWKYEGEVKGIPCHTFTLIHLILSFWLAVLNFRTRIQGPFGWGRNKASLSPTGLSLSSAAPPPKEPSVFTIFPLHLYSKQSAAIQCVRVLKSLQLFKAFKSICCWGEVQFTFSGPSRRHEEKPNPGSSDHPLLKTPPTPSKFYYVVFLYLSFCLRFKL